MTRIGRPEVERIAELARLELSAPEAERMTAELEAILGYVESLDALDTTGVEPTVHALSLGTPLRDDRALPPLAPERALANAPESEDFAFVVPKVLDEDEAW
jgi:aspartyl-tRNA(Asn)/glutamyl-tRNA(Gln) amidotransferase subunit C